MPFKIKFNVIKSHKYIFEEKLDYIFIYLKRVHNTFSFWPFLTIR